MRNFATAVDESAFFFFFLVSCADELNKKTAFISRYRSKNVQEII
jgi:hypothetical protein